MRRRYTEKFRMTEEDCFKSKLIGIQKDREKQRQ